MRLWWRKDRLRRMYLRASLRLKKATGLTLVEMAMAIGVTATMTLSVTATIAEGLRLQMEAGRLTVAVALAQTKLAQLLSNPNLATDRQEGSFDEDAGMYSGYGYEVEVREEQIDLANIAQTGELKGVSTDDQMPTGVQNDAATTEKAGQGAATETGGLVDIVRIIVKITYPRGNKNNDKGTYRVETFQAAKKTRQ